MYTAVIQFNINADAPDPKLTVINPTESCNVIVDVHPTDPIVTFSHPSIKANIPCFATFTDFIDTEFAPIFTSREGVAYLDAKNAMFQSTGVFNCSVMICI